MGRKSPQEKKRLSYAKDRRGDFGENDKSSRKNVPRHKRRVNRENRHRDQLMLTAARGPVDVELAATAEESLLKVRPQRWRKWPDTPLGTLVRGKLDRIDVRRSLEAATVSPLTDDELDETLSAAAYLLSTKDAAALHFLSHTGVRVTELSALDLRDVSTGSVTVRGRRRRTIPLPPELRPSLDAYLRVRAERTGAGEEPAYFLDAFGRRVSPGSVNRVVVAFGILIGLPSLSARTLRMTFAVNLLRAGADLAAVSEMLGHASLDATRDYLAR
ncbi:tyrosine-type recombinase/integrase [Amycolatopsis speibonae]|uniref:Tyrosine-type recombinase/integrase n=1 Tax=Amycolatopsis speibonae TaxID=1450224 RepID=A0ABV7PAG1_9PSEU